MVTGYIDLSGKRFGKLTVIKICSRKGWIKGGTRQAIYWLCKCECGKEIRVRGQSLRVGKTKSCGKKCLLSLVGKRFGKVVVVEKLGRIGKRNSSYKERHYKCRCDCGEICFFTRSQLKHKHKVSMCDECRYPDLTGLRFNKLTVLRKSKIKRGGRTFWICKCDCGKIKAFDGSILKAGIKKGATHRVVSCGCHRKYIKSGKRCNFWKNGNWASGKCSRLLKLRFSCKSNRWRRRVLSRDAYTCKCCGAKSNNKRGLIAHHLWSFTRYWKKRFLVSNGITLCSSCHKMFHSKYGKGDNTPHQFTKFCASFK